jgi:hypothetical protein
MQSAAQSGGRKYLQALIQERYAISFLLAISVGCALAWRFPFPSDQPFLQYVGQERPAILAGLRWTYTAFLFSTPFLFASMLGSFAYVHLYESKQEMCAGSLPPYPDPSSRSELFAVLGEVHERLNQSSARRLAG